MSTRLPPRSNKQQITKTNVNKRRKSGRTRTRTKRKGGRMYIGRFRSEGVCRLPATPNIRESYFQDSNSSMHHQSLRQSAYQHTHIFLAFIIDLFIPHASYAASSVPCFVYHEPPQECLGFGLCTPRKLMLKPTTAIIQLHNCRVVSSSFIRKSKQNRSHTQKTKQKKSKQKRHKIKLNRGVEWNETAGLLVTIRA